ncbi:MAG: hypothetical protein ACO1TE_19680 [Prosthecobacter sp.]
MKPIADLPYFEHELPQLERLKQLFDGWHACFVAGAGQLRKHVADDFVCDGFYPCYFSQKPRILFVGRESRQISGFNNLDLMFQAYRSTKKIGDRGLNSDKFHSRMLYIAHGLTRGMPEWRDIPCADKIGDTFGAPGGVSFAFMNLSKLSNEADGFASDWSVIEAACRLSNGLRRFTEEQVSLLQPDVVITMNLGERLKALGSLEKIDTGLSLTSWWLTSGGHRSLLLDTFHFSARKSGVRDFYDPICLAAKRHLRL